MTQTRHKFTEADAGCWLDSALGIYQGEEIQQIAIDSGMNADVIPTHHIEIIVDRFCAADHTEKDHDTFYHEATQNAEDYLNTLAPQDYYFGSNESGDWGMWHGCDSDDKRTFCDDCFVDPQGGVQHDSFGNYIITPPDDSLDDFPAGFLDENDSYLVHMDWHYPSTASMFGWRTCHDNTDGTIDCPTCGNTASQLIESAQAFLDAIST